MNRSARPDSGMTLVEVMVALSILSVTLIALGGLMYEIARQTQRATVATWRASALQLASGWIQQMPFDSLDLGLNQGGPVGCSSETMGELTYERCVTVSNLGSRSRRVTIVVTPTGNLTAAPDTQVVDRARQLRESPFAQ